MKSEVYLNEPYWVLHFENSVFVFLAYLNVEKLHMIEYQEFVPLSWSLVLKEYKKGNLSIGKVVSCEIPDGHNKSWIGKYKTL